MENIITSIFNDFAPQISPFWAKTDQKLALSSPEAIEAKK